MNNGQSFTRNKQHEGDDGSMSYLIKQGGVKGNLPVILGSIAAVVFFITLLVNV